MIVGKNPDGVTISFCFLHLNPSLATVYNICIGYFAANSCQKKTRLLDLEKCEIGDHGLKLLLREVLQSNPSPPLNISMPTSANLQKLVSIT